MANLIEVVQLGVKPDKEENSFMSNFSKAITSVNTNPVTIDTTEQQPKRRGRPPKKQVADTGTFIPAERKERTPLNSNMSYDNTYNLSKQMLGQVTMQIDDMLSRINEDIDMVRSARTLRNKYNNLSDLYSTAGSLIGNRIAIAREIANIQTNVNKYELAKYKEQNASENDSDEKRLMDMYNAFINAPMGSYGAQAHSQIGMNPAVLNGPMNGIDINTNADGGMFIPANGNEDLEHAAFMRNLTPEQNAIINERNPNIQTVLVYDQTTQNRWFEVIDVTTGLPVPNMPVPSDFIKDKCTIDIRNGLARNADLNQTFKLKLIGNRAMDEF